MYLMPVPHLILFTPCQPSIERDVIHPQLSLLFKIPEIIFAPNLRCVFNIPYYNPHIILRNNFIGSNELQ